MPNPPQPNLPKSKIPAWERRRAPERWKWNGERRGDPRLPRMGAIAEARSRRLVLMALAGTLVGTAILFFALK